MDLSEFYRILKSTSNEVEIQLTSKEHQIFKAHFPKNPILPAFIHLEIINELFNLKITEIKKAKLSEIILPNAIINYIKDKNKFTIFTNNKLVASFTLGVK